MPLLASQTFRCDLASELHAKTTLISFSLVWLLKRRYLSLPTCFSMRLFFFLFKSSHLEKAATEAL